MDKSTQYLIGGILCLIISIAFFVMEHKISAGVVAGFVLFLYGVFRVVQNKKVNWIKIILIFMQKMQYKKL